MVDLSTKGDQVLVTTHSPIFVHGSSFEDVRLVRSNIGRRRSEVFHLDMKNVVENIRRARQDDAALPPQGLAAKIQQSLQPHMAEMLFCRIPVLVEGYEDAAYITAYLHAKDRWRAFRSAGCHLVPVNGKDRLVTALAIARELSISAFTVFDADGDIKGDKKRFHANDNSALIALLSSSAEPFPATTHIDRDHAIWPINIGKSIEGDYGADYERCKNAVAVRYAHEGGLSKNQFFIASLVSFAAESGLYPASLETLCDAIMAFASSCD
jgi:predicted ATP-dependent endonuclease of OLD family